MNQKNSKDKKNKNKSDCGELGRSSNIGSEDHHDKIIRGLREQFKKHFNHQDDDYEDYIDDPATHPGQPKKPTNWRED
jgi:hypothetical protein